MGQPVRDFLTPLCSVAIIKFHVNPEKSSIFPKSAPNFMACLKWVVYLLPWLKIHNIKSNFVYYYHIKGFQDSCMYNV